MTAIVENIRRVVAEMPKPAAGRERLIVLGVSAEQAMVAHWIASNGREHPDDPRLERAQIIEKIEQLKLFGCEVRCSPSSDFQGFEVIDV